MSSSLAGKGSFYQPPQPKELSSFRPHLGENKVHQSSHPSLVWPTHPSKSLFYLNSSMWSRKHHLSHTTIHGKFVQEGPQHGAPAFALSWDVGGMGASLSPVLPAGFPWLLCWRGTQLPAGFRAGLSSLPWLHACNQPLGVMPAL